MTVAGKVDPRGHISGEVQTATGVCALEIRREF